MDKQKCLVVGGASGTVGSEVVKYLANQGMEVRATTRRKSVSSWGNVVYPPVNLVTGEGIRESFEGVERAFLMCPSGYAHQHALLSPLIDEAKRQGLKKVVLMSALGANANESTPLRQAELQLERSGVPYNVVRPNWFFQNFNTVWLHAIREQGQIRLPARNANVSFIDTRDVAAVATNLLLNDQLNNQAFDLTGAEAVSFTETADAISKATGKKITYQEIEPKELKQEMLAAGMNAEYTDFLLVIFGFLAEGYNATVNDNVKRLLARDPIGLWQYASDYKKAWL